MKLKVNKMKKFNKLFNIETTKVQIAGEYGFRKVNDIHDTRKWIKVDGIDGFFQRDDVIEFTNTRDVDMYPAIEDLYYWDNCGSVFERTINGKEFIGKLNGRSIKQFLIDISDLELSEQS